MGIKELALQAKKESNEQLKQNRIKAREDSLSELTENWPERWHMRLDETPFCPARDQFKFEKLTYGDGRGRTPTVSGWSFSIDEVEFIYAKDQGMCVILTCPDCGERHADSWYGLSDLGGKLASQRAMFHKCHTVAVRELAYAIRSAQDATKLPAHQICEDALEMVHSWPSR